MKPRRRHVDPAWQETYHDLIATPAEAVRRVRPGQRVFVGTGCAQPQELVKALVARAADLADVEIVHLLTLGDAPYAHRRLAQHFRVNSFFISENVRAAIQEGLGDYTPVFLSEIPRLFASGALPLDAALIQVTPPDERGMCSLGVSVDIVKSAAQNASLVIAQVNRQMPRTLGESFIPVTDIDVLVPVSAPILELKPYELTETQERIGEYVAALVDDGSTIELGIGRIPHAVLKYLRAKKELGIHTEMLTDAIVDLVESGAVTGSRKSLDRGKIVTSFCLGTKRLYHFIDDNPLFAFHPTEYVNDPEVIGRQNRMVAINVALEVDLTGQVCSDSLGSRFFSGIGGQVDFNRGAARSQGGKAIIALPSTAHEGRISRIVGRLSEGAGVTTTRGDVHYVVTEYGIAYLHGKSVQERAMALISVAHPDYRAKLLHEAIELKYIRPALREVEGKILIQAPELSTTFLLDDGLSVAVRPLRPTDEPLIRDLFYALSQETVYYRYMQHLKRLPERTIQNFVFIDHRTEVALAATVPEAHGEDIIAVGRYYLDLKTNQAEVAFVVRDKWQRRGIGTFLLKHLIAVARRAGIAGFTAEVLANNRPMQKVFRKCPCRVTSQLRGDVVHFELGFG